MFSPPPSFFEQLEDRLNLAVYDTNEEIRMASIEALKAKLASASGVVQRATASIESKADALIAREQQMEAKASAAFAPHNQLLDVANTSLDSLESALNQMTNGGPPLEASTPSAPASAPASGSPPHAGPYPTYP